MAWMKRKMYVNLNLPYNLCYKCRRNKDNNQLKQLCQENVHYKGAKAPKMSWKMSLSLCNIGKCWAYKIHTVYELYILHIYSIKEKGLWLVASQVLESIKV